MPKGRKKNHKGGFRHFTSEEQMKADAEKQRKEREWRKQKGIESSEDEEEEAKGAAESGRTVEPGELPASSSEESDSEDDEPQKPKGVEHLIEIENPNRVAAKSKKVSQLDVESAKPELSRREREELAKQQSRERYQKLHQEGKTDEARADMARLALIRKQREEAQKKRDTDKKDQDAKQASTLAAEKEKRKGGKK